MRLTGPRHWGDYPDRDGTIKLPPAVRPLPATTSIEHLRENLAAQDLVLTADDLAALT